MRVHACVIAVGAVSGLGMGREAYAVGAAELPARSAVRRDLALEGAGHTHAASARAPAIEADSGQDPATVLLTFALRDTVRALDRTRPDWRRERIGVAIGTSSGAMSTAEQFFAAHERGEATAAMARSATYFAPLDDALGAVGIEPGAQRVQVLAACAASTIALGIGLRWLELGRCDVVFAGGYDALSLFVAAGFDALRATTNTTPRPFRVGRDGMVLGEGAAVVALVRSDNARSVPVIARITGFGASNDAVHITAPDRTGAGIAKAAALALGDAGAAPSQVDLVSAHGTATPYNDAMEARAIRSLFCGAEAPVVHPFKAQIGHTLGAAGALEMLAAADAINTGVVPAALGGDSASPIDPDSQVRLLDRSESRPVRAALKLSAAFGGSNAALVLSAAEAVGARPPKRTSLPAVLGAVRVRHCALPWLAAACRVPVDRIARMDALCQLALGSVASLAEAVGREPMQGAGILVGHALASLDTNARFDAQRRSRGAARVDPRLFPRTSPNVAVGECAIAFQLTGPSFAVGSGLDGAMEALRVGALLVESGDAERVVVVGVDEVGPVSRDLARLAGFGDRPMESGAVALLLGASSPSARRGLLPEIDVHHGGDGPVGHLSLTRWLERLHREGGLPLWRS